MNENVISLRGIQKNYKIYERNIIHRLQDTFLPSLSKKMDPFYALKNIDLDVKNGEILGIVGRNGSGKSTLLKIISGITTQTKGTVDIKGNVIPLLELGGGFNPEYTGRENIYLNCALLGLKKSEIDDRFNDIVEFSELEEFIDMPIKKYSSGMKARLGFAVSINIDPDILILDEVLSVGDELFKRKCFVKMQEFFKSGKTILFVSHSSQNILNICSRVILLHKGQKLLDGEPDYVMKQYARLLNCEKGKEEQVVNSILKMENYPEKKTDTKTPEKAEGLLLKPKSTRIVKKKRIILKKAKLTDNKGQEIHLLDWGKKYRLRFRLKICENIKNFKFEVIIHDKHSNIISESIYPDNYEHDLQLEKGQIVRLSCGFFSYLKPGLYGITFVMRTTESGTIKDAIKADDIILFKIITKTVSDKSSVQLFGKKPSLVIRGLNHKSS